ncbi:MAG TPA: ABC transporter substrate-binding protein [Bauldia sp.]|nr:ABC transporter substrate-binding protein [Bauldia sp.]
MIVRIAAAAAAIAALLSGSAMAEDTVKVGLIASMTGPFAPNGKQMELGARLYMQEHGDTVAGKKIELIVKDDASVPDNSKRLAQELVVNDGVKFLMGMNLTPIALAVAPVATQAKVPLIVTLAGTSIITEKSPYIVRTSFTLPQSAVVMADWAAKNGIKKVVTMVSDYAPGADAEKWFVDRFKAAGGEVVESIKVPLANPDFAPFLQRAADDKPDALYIFVPVSQGGVVMKQFVERGMDKQGIRLIGPGDFVDDELLNGMGDAALGVITAHNYSVAHPSDMNKKFVAAYKAASGGGRPNFVGVHTYDGMHLVYAALDKTGGDTDGDKLVEAMKGMSWESPRGPISIDPDTRDIIQNIYMRKVERGSDGELYNVEFATIEAVKDPVKAAK